MKHKRLEWLIKKLLYIPVFVVEKIGAVANEYPKLKATIDLVAGISMFYFAMLEGNPYVHSTALIWMLISYWDLPKEKRK